MAYYEQIVVLRIRIDEEEPGGAPSSWTNWPEVLDLARPDGAEVIASGELIGPNEDEDKFDASVMRVVFGGDDDGS
jgi:hypothetical protein